MQEINACSVREKLASLDPVSNTRRFVEQTIRQPDILTFLYTKRGNVNSVIESSPDKHKLMQISFWDIFCKTLLAPTLYARQS